MSEEATSDDGLKQYFNAVRRGRDPKTMPRQAPVWSYVQDSDSFCEPSHAWARSQSLLEVVRRGQRLDEGLRNPVVVAAQHSKSSRPSASVLASIFASQESRISGGESSSFRGSLRQWSSAEQMPSRLASGGGISFTKDVKRKLKQRHQQYAFGSPPRPKIFSPLRQAGRSALQPAAPPGSTSRAEFEAGLDTHAGGIPPHAVQESISLQSLHSVDLAVSPHHAPDASAGHPMCYTMRGPSVLSAADESESRDGDKRGIRKFGSVTSTSQGGTDQVRVAVCDFRKGHSISGKPATAGGVSSPALPDVLRAVGESPPVRAAPRLGNPAAKRFKQRQRRRIQEVAEGSARREAAAAARKFRRASMTQDDRTSIASLQEGARVNTGISTSSSAAASRGQRARAKGLARLFVSAAADERALKAAKREKEGEAGRKEHAVRQDGGEGKDDGLSSTEVPTGPAVLDQAGLHAASKDTFWTSVDPPEWDREEEERTKLQLEAAHIIEERVVRENMGRPLASRQGHRALAPTRALDGQALTLAMREAETSRPGLGLATLAAAPNGRRGAIGFTSRRGRAPMESSSSLGSWSLHDRIDHMLAGQAPERRGQSAAISAGIGLAKRARERRSSLSSGHTLFAESKSTQVSYGSTIAMSSADGRFLVVDPLTGEVRLQEPEHRWRERGISPFQAQRVGPGDSRMIPCPFFLFKVVDIGRPTNGDVVRLGDPVWLVVAGGRGEGSWRKGSVLGAHVQQGVELEQAAAAPYTASALEAVRNDSMNLLAVPQDFRERELLEQSKNLSPNKVPSVLESLASNGETAGLPAKASAAFNSPGLTEADSAPIARQLMARARRAMTQQGALGGSPPGSKAPDAGAAASPAQLSTRNGQLATHAFSNHIVSPGGAVQLAQQETLDDRVTEFVSRCQQLGVGLGGVSRRQASEDADFDADDVTGDVSERLRGKTLMGSTVENPIDKVAGALGVPVPTKAFVPRAPAENVLLGPTTQGNQKGVYKAADPGYDVLYQLVNRKATVLGKWLIEPAYKSRLPDGSMLGALGPEDRKATAAKESDTAPVEADGASIGQDSPATGGVHGTSFAEETEFEWKSRGGEEARAKSKREAAMDPRDLARRRRVEAEQQDLSDAIKSEDRHALGNRDYKVLKKGDKLLNLSKVYLSQDWLYISGAATQPVEIPPSVKELDAEETHAMLTAAGTQLATIEESSQPEAHTSSETHQKEGVRSANRTGSNNSQHTPPKRKLRSKVAPASLEYMRRHLGARRVVLNRLESGVHGPFKVEARGVFTVHLADAGPTGKSRHTGGTSLTAHARAQLAAVRRMRNGGFDRDRPQLASREDSGPVAQEIRTATFSIRMASGSQFTQRMHQARLEAQRAADRLYLEHEAAKGAAGVSYYGNVAARVRRKERAIGRGAPFVALDGRKRSMPRQHSNGTGPDIDPASPSVDEQLWEADDIDSDDLDDGSAAGSRPWSKSMGGSEKPSRAASAFRRQKSPAISTAASRERQSTEGTPGARSGLKIRRPKRPLWVRLQATGRRIDEEVKRMARGEASTAEEADYLRSTDLLRRASTQMARTSRQGSLQAGPKGAVASSGAATAALLSSPMVSVQNARAMRSHAQAGSAETPAAESRASPYVRPRGVQPLEVQLEEQEGAVVKTASILERLEAKAERKLLQDKGRSGLKRTGADSGEQLVDDAVSVDSGGTSEDSDIEATTPGTGRTRQQRAAPRNWDGRPVFGERLVVDGAVVASTALGAASERAMQREVRRLGMPYGERERLRTMVLNSAKERESKKGAAASAAALGSRSCEPGIAEGNEARSTPVPAPVGAASTTAPAIAAASSNSPRTDAVVERMMHHRSRPASRVASQFDRAMEDEDDRIQRLVQVGSRAKRDAAIMEKLLMRDDAYELPAGRDPQAMLAYVRPDKVVAKLVVPGGRAVAGGGEK